MGWSVFDNLVGCGYWVVFEVGWTVWFVGLFALWFGFGWFWSWTSWGVSLVGFSNDAVGIGDLGCRWSLGCSWGKYISAVLVSCCMDSWMTTVSSKQSSRKCLVAVLELRSAWASKGCGRASFILQGGCERLWHFFLFRVSRFQGVAHPRGCRESYRRWAETVGRQTSAGSNRRETKFLAFCLVLLKMLEDGRAVNIFVGKARRGPLCVDSKFSRHCRQSGFWSKDLCIPK